MKDWTLLLKSSKHYRKHSLQFLLYSVLIFLLCVVMAYSTGLVYYLAMMSIFPFLYVFEFVKHLKPIVMKVRKEAENKEEYSYFYKKFNEKN